ncbi:MAG: ScpA family protein [Acidimicrobiia bacterium]
MAYEVATPVYEGPFDLLLHLILSDEVDLWEVPLARIIDAYLDELERMESLDLEVATEFLLIAATLVELKARRLLPSGEEIELDEELLRFEERDLLLARLLECKTFKDAAAAFEDRAAHAARSAPRTIGPEEPYASMAPDPLERISPTELREAAIRAMTVPESPSVATDHVAPIRASVKDAVTTVLSILEATGPTTFRALVVGVTDRLEFVVRFLAVLELCKQGAVEIDQVTTFGDLTVRPLELDIDATARVSLDDWGEDDPAVSGGAPGSEEEFARS